MNKSIMIAAIIILILIGGGMYIANQQSQKAEEAKMEQEKAATAAKEDAIMKGKDAQMKKDEGRAMEKSDSRYVTYSKAAFEGAVDKRRVLYFYANWCPICRPTDANFKENVSKIPQDLVVIQVNYNDTDTDQEEKDLAKKYEITYQHTFVQIDGKGNPVTKWNGGQITELLANIK